MTQQCKCRWSMQFLVIHKSQTWAEALHTSRLSLLQAVGTRAAIDEEQRTEVLCQRGWSAAGIGRRGLEPDALAVKVCAVEQHRLDACPWHALRHGTRHRVLGSMRARFDTSVFYSTSLNLSTVELGAVCSLSEHALVLGQTDRATRWMNWNEVTTGSCPQEAPQSLPAHRVQESHSSRPVLHSRSRVCWDCPARSRCCMHKSAEALCSESAQDNSIGPSLAWAEVVSIKANRASKPSSYPDSCCDNPELRGTLFTPSKS